MDLSSVASRAAEIFAGSKIEQKRQLIAFVFSNLRLKGKKLEFSLRSPFDLMVDRPDHASWLGDLDPKSTPHKSQFSAGFAPLSHIGCVPEVCPVGKGRRSRKVRPALGQGRRSDDTDDNTPMNSGPNPYQISGVGGEAEGVCGALNRRL